MLDLCDHDKMFGQLTRWPAIVLFVLLMGCSGAVTPADLDTGAVTPGDLGTEAVTAEDLGSARARWANAEVDSYRFRVYLANEWFYARTFDVIVEDGDVVGILPVEGDWGEWDAESAEDFFTVLRLFDSVERWWLDDEHSSVSFDADLGYPKSVESDDPQADDDQVIVKVSDFQSLES